MGAIAPHSAARLFNHPGSGSFGACPLAHRLIAKFIMSNFSQAKGNMKATFHIGTDIVCGLSGMTLLHLQRKDPPNILR